MSQPAPQTTSQPDHTFELYKHMTTLSGVGIGFTLAAMKGIEAPAELSIFRSSLGLVRRLPLSILHRDVLCRQHDL